MITFTATVQMHDDIAVVRLPESASRQLPSRGQVTVKGTMNNEAFIKVVEPDGNFGHWFKLGMKDVNATHLKDGEVLHFAIEPTKDWPEPTIPNDFEQALAGASVTVNGTWRDITPMARWEWVRWVNATNNTETRQRRIEVSLSKLDAGKRRPCCFNLASCTDPELAKSGKLIGLYE